MKKLLLSLMVVGFASVASAQEWLTNFEEAQKKSKSENKQLLMNFTGSDWCGWCIKLDREVFSKPEFQEYAAKNLVLLKLDFPRKTQLPAAEVKQNEKLSEKYRIEGFPTLVVLNPSGSKAGTLGYVPGGPEAFIKTLKADAPKK